MEEFKILLKELISIFGEMRDIMREQNEMSKKMSLKGEDGVKMAKELLDKIPAFKFTGFPDPH